MDHLARYLRHAWFLLLRERRLSFAAILTIGLAIGANATLFGVVRSVLLDPLPYRDPDRLFMIWKDLARGETTWLSLREILEYGRAASTLERVEGYTTIEAALTGNAQPERVSAAAVTPGFFSALGVSPMLGRTLGPGDAAPGAERAAVIGYGLWQRRFGADPTLVGQRTAVNGVQTTVVGVMPPGFRLPRDFAADRPTEAWMPVVVDSQFAGAWGDRSFIAVARLRPGAAVEAARADLHLIAERWMQAGYLRDNGDGQLYRDLVPLQTFVTGEIRTPLLVLLAAVVAVLLVACANVANLLLAQADSRRREMAMRTALGASRSEILRQALVESCTLAGAGGLLGLALAWAATRAFVLVSASTLPRAGSVSVDPFVISIAAGLTLLSGLAFGVLPALRSSRPDLVAALNGSGRSDTMTRRRHAFRRALVIGQLAGSVVLLVTAGLLIRSLVEMSNVELGFDDRRVLVADLQLPATDYPEPSDVVRFYREITERLGTASGVEAAGAVRVLPLSRTIGDWSITIEGRPIDPNENPNADFQAVTPGYFAAMRLSLARGRTLTAADREGAPIVAVVNEVMASRHWPGEDAVGKRFRLGTADQPWVTIVGIVRQVRHNAVIEDPRAEMYLAHAQLPDEIGSTPRGMALVIRTAGDPRSMAGALREIVSAMDRQLPIGTIRTMDAVTGNALAGPRFTAVVLAIFAAIALVIAAVGVYATIALLVSERAPEMGIRLALGATPGRIFRMVVGQGMGLGIAGLAIGIAGAVLAGRAVGGLLYGVRSLDPLTFVLVPLALALVTLAACAGPARRATKVDPIVTLGR